MQVIQKLFIPVLLTIHSIAFSQEKPRANELDNKYTPEKNSIFNSDDVNSSGKTSAYEDIKQAVKFNPMLMLRSTAALFYEYAISDEITVQGGIGFCYNKDRIQQSMASEFFSAQLQSSLSVGQIMQASEHTRSKIFLSLSCRFYTSEIFDGGYFELGSRYNVNALRAMSESDFNIVGAPEVKIRNSNFHILWGHQTYTSGKLKTTHDIYFGMGLRSTQYDVFRSETIEDTQSLYGGFKTYNYITPQRERVRMLSVLFGYVFGFGF